LANVNVGSNASKYAMGWEWSNHYYGGAGGEILGAEVHAGRGVGGDWWLVPLAWGFVLNIPGIRDDIIVVDVELRVSRLY